MPSDKKATVRAYASPTAVLLAFDWEEGKNHPDFLGFAIRRSPGYAPGHAEDFLYNKINFEAPKKGTKQKPTGSDKAPIQKFLWWDGGINTDQRGSDLTYTVTPVLGNGPLNISLQRNLEVSCTVRVPTIIDADGIGSYFNRAVVSSQAFREKFTDKTKIDAAMVWLANGLQDAIPQFLLDAKNASHEVLGAIYHLTDNRWIVPALKNYPGEGNLVYFWKEGTAPHMVAAKPGKPAYKTKGSPGDTVDQYAIAILEQAGWTTSQRTKANIMHDKFLVRSRNGKAQAVLMGSANFTPEAITCQANLMHTFESEALAQLYANRHKELQSDPTVGALAKKAGWSKKISIGNARVRAFFPPEGKDDRHSIDECVKAVNNAKSSVILCMFSPTDAALLDAFGKAGDNGKLLYGLLNAITDPSQSKKRKQAIADGEDPGELSDSAQVQIDLYNRSKSDHKVLAYNYFRPGATPANFLPELSTIDTSKWSTVPPAKPSKGKNKKGGPPAVHIHHKFVVIDADTDEPIIYTGSANMSNNSAHRNDENLLEITGSPTLAHTYLAEFMRLYEHFRARAIWNDMHPIDDPKKTKSTASKKTAGGDDPLILKRSRDKWVKRAFESGTPAFNARTRLARSG